MIFIALGLLSLIYSGFITLSVLVQVAVNIKSERSFSFSFKQAMLWAMAGTSLICLGAGVL